MRLRVAVHAEWTKLRTLPGTVALLLTGIGLTVAGSALVAAGTSCPAPGCGVDPVPTSLAGVDVGQAVVVVLAVVVGAEHGGMLRLGLAAMPCRATVLAAKATVVSALVLPTGGIAVAGSLLTGRYLLPRNGITAAHGYPSPWHDHLWRAATGTLLYLVLIALLALGTAVATRAGAVAVGTVLGLLYLFPIAAAVTDPDWSEYLERIGPMTAGLAAQTTVGRPPIGAWAGLGVLACWSAAALAAAALRLRLTDA